MDLPEGIQTAFDKVTAGAVLTWNFLSSAADIAVDLITGRELPEPGLKSVATAPEPGALCKVRPPATISRTTRAKIREDKAA